MRHGETDWSLEGRRQGHHDSPLTSRGRAQAYEAATALQQVGVDAIYTSPLGRAAMTASIVAAVLELPVRTVDLAREIDHGAFSGLTNAEIEACDPGVLAQRDADKYTWTFPDGELRRRQPPRGSSRSGPARDAFEVAAGRDPRDARPNACCPAVGRAGARFPHVGPAARRVRRRRGAATTGRQISARWWRLRRIRTTRRVMRLRPSSIAGTGPLARAASKASMEPFRRMTANCSPCTFAPVGQPTSVGS